MIVRALKRSFLRASIGQKLLISHTATSLLAVIALSAGFTLHQHLRTRQDLVDRTVSLSYLLSDRVERHLFDHNGAAAAGPLQWLEREPTVLAAWVYGVDGTVEAEYRAANTPDVPIPRPELVAQVRFDDEFLHRSCPVIADGRRVGTLHLVVCTEPLRAQQRESLLIALVMFLSASALGLVLAAVFRRLLAVPILNVVWAARRIATSRDYSVRVSRSTARDELAQLVDAFNSMVEEVQRRDVALEQAKDDLENRVEERTVELEQATARAIAANEAKSTFLTSVSHELRTPMNGVLGMLDLLRGARLAPRERRFVRTAHRSAVALLSLVNDLLDLSKIEAGELDIERARFSVRDLVEELGDQFAPLAHKKRLELCTFVSPDIPDVLEGDSLRLRQVLTNLVGNGIRFTERGEVGLRVDVAARGDGEVEVEFSVRDTGIGIASDALESIFDALETDSERRGSSGLGLAISRRIVDAMNGRLAVDSEIGTGSVFRASVPFGVVEANATSSAEERFFGRVVVADRNATSSDNLRAYLEHWGLDAVVCRSESELRALLARGGSPPAALIVDDDLAADRDGLADAVKETISEARIPVFLMVRANVDTLAGSRSGIRADGLLGRPIRVTELRDALSSALHGDAVTGASERPETGIQATFGGRVLLIEDNEVNQEVAQAILESLGYSVSIAATGTQAIERLTRESFDVALMDVQLPEMDGVEVTRRLREWEASQEVPGRLPVIALTASAGVEDRRRFLASGMDDVLAKPFTERLLATMLARWVTGITSDEPVERAAAGPGSDMFDPDVVNQLRALEVPGRPSVLARLADAFRTECEGAMAEIRQAIERRDGATMQAMLRRLRTTAGNVGARRVTSRCVEFEALARAGNWEGAASGIERLESEIASAVRYLGAQSRQAA